MLAPAPRARVSTAVRAKAGSRVRSRSACRTSFANITSLSFGATGRDAAAGREFRENGEVSCRRQHSRNRKKIRSRIQRACEWACAQSRSSTEGLNISRQTRSGRSLRKVSIQLRSGIGQALPRSQIDSLVELAGLGPELQSGRLNLVAPLFHHLPSDRDLFITAVDYVFAFQAGHHLVEGWSRLSDAIGSDCLADDPAGLLLGAQDSQDQELEMGDGR